MERYDIDDRDDTKIYTRGIDLSETCKFVKENGFFSDIGKGCAYIEIQGINYKGGTHYFMEDRCLFLPNLTDHSSLVAVFDGHGGSGVAEFFKRNFESILKGEMTKNSKDVVKSLKNAIKKLDKNILTYDNLETRGSTLGGVILEADRLIVFNVGDTEAVLSRDGERLLLTQLHNLKSEKEREKLLKKGAKIENGFLEINNKVLKLTRTLGDRDMGRNFISSEPFIDVVTLEENDKWLILASDGLWDKVSYEEAIETVNFADNPMKAVGLLKDMAFRRNLTDDITILVIGLK